MSRSVYSLEISIFLYPALSISIYLSKSISLRSLMLFDYFVYLNLFFFCFRFQKQVIDDSTLYVRLCRRRCRHPGVIGMMGMMGIVYICLFLRIYRICLKKLRE